MARLRLPIWLTEELRFPPLGCASAEGLLAIGGDLQLERLLLAYSTGIFPWPGEGMPLLWFAPPERAVVRPSEIHVGRSLRKVVQRGPYEVRLDTNFAAVIGHCAKIPRRHESGTWILPEMIDAYCALHEAGFAHSVETYQAGELVGGLYGISLGGMFFGESMFAKADDASKVAMVRLSEQLVAWNFDLIDGQVMNHHLERLGFALIPRAEYMATLRRSLQKPTRRGKWTFSEPG
ncbi:MAG TPA: leucyl/phenylalanyl-tRNA--protein transferase [Pseudomonadota bacterium]|nr:leucyl/phenylalanyl-tRNA--protein transferase [Pseudomonadota bacterium]HNN52196.1 leucyl/phenylalanyl-tRNA--protein transferase [Pseudomonadota bacterium]